MAFIAQKHANDSMGPITFVGARFLLSAIVVAPLAFWEHARAGCPSPNAVDRRLALVVGICLFVGACLQQIGLVSTTATNGGFLTALYVIFVPPIVWAVTGSRPRPIIVVAAVSCLAGSWLLAGAGAIRGWSRGDSLIVIADLAWAGAIALAPVFLSRTGRPFYLAAAQYGVVAVLGLGAGLGLEPFSAAGLRAAAPSILYAGLLSGAVAFTLQLVAQQFTPPAEAALIMSLESVFAALAGAALLSERLAGPALLGCGLILAGVFVAEAGPLLRTLTLRRARGWRIGRGARPWQEPG
jgi:drug/metabolite transporter (DMT)-like permease